MTDLLSDFIIRLKNGYRNQKQVIYIIKTKICFNILTLLYKEGYINGFKVCEQNNLIEVYLKYINNLPVITDIKIISKPSKKIYSRVKDLDKKSKIVLTTSKGILMNKDAKFFNIGGKMLFQII